MPTKSEAMYNSLLFDGIDTDLHIYPTTTPFEVDEWKCVVCHGTPRYPASLSSCGHLGCRGCLLKVLETKLNSYDEEDPCKCPMCPAKFTEEEIIPLAEWPLLMRSAWNGLRVNCRGFKEYDRIKEDFQTCHFSGSIRDLIEHEKTDCGNRIILCPAANCSYSGPAFKMVDHYNACDKLVYHCSLCGMARKFVEREQHNCIEALQKSLKILEKQCKQGKFQVSKALFPGKPGTLCQVVAHIDEEPTQPAASIYPFDTLQSAQPQGGDWIAPGDHSTPVTSPVVASTNAPARRANTVGRVLF